ncbi:hypothetical protein J3R30DRAFT_3702596 [Lentinula aciculospora]|uniref:Thioesterase/thiol ester dehydrase-isomerase n=1 Tax=Lentinula aciculospora TaxID=153920 RepID=A0A9W9DPU9_9AGAR|nr:hypothetical protein J3R30DRAFT_3702596 [Lentinula aciculospora]
MIRRRRTSLAPAFFLYLLSSTSTKTSSALSIISKYVLYAIILANVRGAPATWHWRVFWPIIKYNLQFLAFRVPNFFATVANRTERDRRIAEYIDKTSPVGVHPFDFKVIYRSRVSVDESDFNMHMSNSSYPKVLDFTRTKMATHLFPHFLRAGGVVPIASTHFHFVREIPMLAKYEVRAGIGAWDEKWFYVVGRFVTNRKSKSTGTQPSSSPIHPLTLTNSESDLIAKLVDTSPEDEENITLHTVAVARCCYKLGRITVPPSVLMATNGVCVYPDQVTMTDLDPEFSKSLDVHSGYSVDRPPHTWTSHARDLALNPKKLREFYKGAWRQDSTRWWDSAMGVGGPMDKRLKERLEICRNLFEGMDGIRQFGEA